MGGGRREGEGALESKNPNLKKTFCFFCFWGGGGDNFFIFFFFFFWGGGGWGGIGGWSK